MRVVAAYKWAWEAENARVSPDGAVDWSNSRPVPGRDDGAVLRIAKEVGGALGADVVGITVGQVNADWALARGATAVLVADDATVDPASPGGLAAALAALVRRAGDVGLVVIGSSAVETGAPLVPAVMAAELGWPAVTDVGGVQVEDGRVRVTRPVPSGDEVVEVATPALIAVTASAAEAPIPGMRDLLDAKRKARTAIEALDVPTGNTGDVEVLAVRRAVPTPRAGRVVDGSEPDVAARELVSILQAEGVL